MADGRPASGGPAVDGARSGRLRRGALAKLGSEVLVRLVSFAVVLWAARVLGEADFGLYSYGLALGFVLSQGADFGLQALTAREVALRGPGGASVATRGLELKVLLTVPVVLLLLLLTAGHPVPLRAALLFLGVTMVLQTFVEFGAYVLRGNGELLREVRLLTGVRLLVAAAAALVLWRGGGLLLLSVAGFAATLAGCAVALWILRRDGWIGLRVPSRPPRLALLGRAAPLGVAMFLSIAYLRAGLLLLQHLAGETAVAHLSVAQRLVEASQVLPAAVLAAVFPAYTRALREAPAAARRLGVASGLGLGTAGLLLAAGLWLAAPLAVPLLFGPEFAEATPVLRLLALAVPLMYLNHLLTHLLIARGRQGTIGRCMAVVLPLHLVGSVWLIPRAGAAGVAASMVVAEAVLLLGCALGLRAPARHLAGGGDLAPGPGVAVPDGAPAVGGGGIAGRRTVPEVGAEAGASIGAGAPARAAAPVAGEPLTGGAP